MPEFDYKLSKDSYPEITITQDGVVIDRGINGVEVIRPRVIDVRLPDGVEASIGTLVGDHLKE